MVHILQRRLFLFAFTLASDLYKNIAQCHLPEITSCRER